MPRKPTKAAARAVRRGAQRAAPDAAPLSIVVLAAGQGKRMRSELPKALQPLAGAPLLSHCLTVAESLAPASIHVVYGHGGEAVRARFAGAALEWWRQEPQQGTGHALKQALPGIQDPEQVLVLYGDVPLLRAETLRALLDAARARDGLGLLTAELEQPQGYGRIVRDIRGRLRAIVEDRDASERERRIREINTGVITAPARLLRQWLGALKPHNAQGEYYLTDIIAMAVRERLEVATVVCADAVEVLGVNDKQQLAAAETEYRRRRAHALMAEGVTIVDPARIDLRGPISVGCDVLLDVNVILEGPVKLGDGVHVGANCLLSDVEVGSRTVLHSNCVLHGARIGMDCVVGPFARVRPQSHVADGVHLGNFVEIKNSTLGPGSKVNHLSYVGDAQVGSAVNVGAGSITCNYDGANKWQTEIGDSVFVGSGCMLVAPVKIGDGATIGAGSTITEDVPPGKLTLARAHQVTIENWHRPRKPSPKS